MDHAGAILIGVATLWLFGRIMSACAHRNAVHGAMTQHHRAPATTQTGRAQAALQRLMQLAAGLDSRLKLAGGIGVATVALSAAPAAVQSYAGGDSTIGKALGVTLRWALMAGLIHTLRRAVRAWRPTARAAAAAGRVDTG